MDRDPVLVTVELRFRGAGDPAPLGERIREAVAQIVGRQSLEEFRVRVLPLTPPTHVTEEPFVD
ncbi:MAG: hypothetical protein ACKO8G_07765 [Actinomycetota bacterium]